MNVWNLIKDSSLLANTSWRSILREPSPILFAAIHYTMNNHFDMDEIFQLLIDDKTKVCT